MIPQESSMAALKPMKIRPFAPGWYPEITALWNSAYPDMLRTAEEWGSKDEQLAVRLNLRRWIVEQDGEVFGFGNFQHDEWMIHPHKFMLRIVVAQEYQRQGVGSALMAHLLNELRPFDAHVVRSWARQDTPAGIEFLKAHGFAEFHRVWISHLEVSAFEFQPYEGYEQRLRTQGIQIMTLQDLEGDPDRDRRLYELECELIKDVPAPDPFVPKTFEMFAETLHHDPKVLPRAYFVAVHNGEYVGQSVLWGNKADEGLDTGLTAVRRAYRRKGIALALKLQGVAYARQHRHPVIRTGNDSLNLPMLSINEQLGFAKLPAWILFSKQLKNA